MMNLARIPAVLAGTGASRNIGREVRRVAGSRAGFAVLLTGASSFDRNPASSDILASLKDAGFSLIRLKLGGEPSPSDVDRFVEEIRLCCGEDERVPVIGIGGGSVIDAAKAAAACATMDKPAVRYLEGVGDLSPDGTRLPLIAVPTSSGTGSEATMNSVLSETGPEGFKKSMRHSSFIPDTAIFDPLLLNGAAYPVTAASGWDAVTQLLEAAVSSKANRLTDHYSFAGLAAAATAFPAVCALAKEPSAFTGEEALRIRLEMAIAAFYGGIALANAGLGLVHGAASPLGALRPIPHGVVCGLLLPPATRAILKRLDSSEGGRRYAAAGYLLSGRAVCEAEAFALSCSDKSAAAGQELLMETLNTWKEHFPLPSFTGYGFTSEELATAAENSSMKNSPALVPAEDILAVFEACSGRNG